MKLELKSYVSRDNLEIAEVSSRVSNEEAGKSKCLLTEI